MIRKVIYDVFVTREIPKKKRKEEHETTKFQSFVNIEIFEKYVSPMLVFSTHDYDEKNNMRATLDVKRGKKK